MNIAFLPMRGGSKGIKDKNIYPICGIPLMYYTLTTLEDYPFFDEIIVSSDSDKILKMVDDLKISRVKLHKRSSKNSGDLSKTEDAMLEYFTKHMHHDTDIVSLFQATNPFVELHHIEQAINAIYKKDYDSALTVAKLQYFRWHYRGVPLNYHPMERPRRQEWTGEFYENGGLYATTVGHLLRRQARVSGHTYLVVMPPWTINEIDEPIDIKFASAILEDLYGEKINRVRKRCRAFL